MSNRLGLHLSHQALSIGSMARELRKRAFWSLYTLDW
jgi:hypothetical protein